MTNSLIMKIQMASNWSNDYLTSRLASINLDVSMTEQEALLELIQYLKNIDTTTDKDELAMTIQSEIFSIAQRRGLSAKGIFQNAL